MGCHGTDPGVARLVTKYEVWIKGMKHVISILDIFLFAGSRVERIQKEKEYDRENESTTRFRSRQRIHRNGKR